MKSYQYILNNNSDFTDIQIPSGWYGQPKDKIIIKYNSIRFFNKIITDDYEIILENYFDKENLTSKSYQISQYQINFDKVYKKFSDIDIFEKYLSHNFYLFVHYISDVTLTIGDDEFSTIYNSEDIEYVNFEIMML